MGLRLDRIGVAVLLVGCSLEPLSTPLKQEPTPSAGGTGTGGAGGVPASGGNPGAGGDGSGGSAPWPEGFTYRRRVFIEAESPLPAGYALSIEIDHAAWVDAGHSRADGDDVRLFYEGEGGFVEHHRIVDPASEFDRSDTRLWFALIAPLGGDKKLKLFWLYYGKPNATRPPADPSLVYDFWDFDRELDESLTADVIGAGTFEADVSRSKLTLTGTTGSLGPSADDFGFVHRNQTGDFVLDARVVGVEGVPGPSSIMGGVMARASLGADAAFAAIGPTGTGAHGFFYRASTGGVGEALGTAAPAMPWFVRLVRLGDEARAFTSDDGLAWSPLGSGVKSSALAADLEVGMAFATGGLQTSVSVDWLRVRPLVEEEADVFAQDEQALLD